MYIICITGDTGSIASALIEQLLKKKKNTKFMDAQHQKLKQLIKIIITKLLIQLIKKK